MFAENRDIRYSRSSVGTSPKGLIQFNPSIAARHACTKCDLSHCRDGFFYHNPLTVRVRAPYSGARWEIVGENGFSDP
jgi:hypothetical protein